MLRCAQVPELQCGELSGTVLQLKALGVDNVMAFDYLAPPPAEAMVKAAELLFALGAIDDKSRSWLTLTSNADLNPDTLKASSAQHSTIFNRWPAL